MTKKSTKAVTTTNTNDINNKNINLTNQIKKGDVVWVRTGLRGTHEEPAIILETSCHYQYYPLNDGDDDNDDNKEYEEKKESTDDNDEKLNQDGFLVRYTVSLIEEIVYYKNVRRLLDDDDDDDDDEGRKIDTYKPKRRSSRSRIKHDKTLLLPETKQRSFDGKETTNSENNIDNVTLSKLKSKKNASSSSSSSSSSSTTITNTSKTSRSKKRKSIDPLKDELPIKTSNAKKKQKTIQMLDTVSTTSPYFNKSENIKESKKSQKITETKNSLAGKPDGFGGLINPDSIYIIEYAVTSRSTCKRCDVKISKGELRVGHRPLFRGKPGFRIYKHLNCIIFSSEVTCGADVDGYDDLEKKDQQLLEERIVQSMNEIHEENQALDPDELVQKAFEGEIREKPRGLTANLLPFQTEGVSWMYCQEVNVPDIRGGILADEMGMGKTLQTITVILDNKPKLQQSACAAKHPPNCSDELTQKLVTEEQLWNKCLKDWKHEIKMNEIPTSILPKKKSAVGGGARAGTLIICPVIALTQWKSEIEKFCDSSSLSVCIYHGSDRVKEVPREVMGKYDVVLTTYQVIEHDFRKMVSPNKVKCPNCGNRFKIDKLHIHLKYFCGEGAKRTEAQSRTRRNLERDNSSRSKKRKSTQKKGYYDPKSNSRKTFTAKNNTTYYDSESDTSTTTDIIVPKTRSPRAAASRARSLVAATARKEREDNMIENSSDDDYIMSENDDNVIFSDNDSTIQRAKARQAIAIRVVKDVKNGIRNKATGKKESLSKHKKAGKRASNQSKKVRNIKEHFNDRSDDDSISETYDPELSDVDMDVLIAEAMAGCQLSPLHSFCWWRIVLDEAHFIKSRSSQTSAAAFSLIGIHRWCLTGTPLQNRVGEFYSLVRFLRLDPMAHYLCRRDGCLCKQVHYRMRSGRCMDCGHSSIQHYSYFNRTVLNPIQRDGYANDGRRAMFTLKNEVLDRCLLRRTKDTRAEDMNLPPRIVSIKKIRLHPFEEDFYNAVYTQTTSSFNEYVTEGTLLNNYAHIFDLLMRMRQAVCHPYLVVHSKSGVSSNANASNATILNRAVDCALCNETPTDCVVSTCCQTAFCKSCVMEYMEVSAGVRNGENSLQCPSCRNPFTIDINQVQESYIDESTSLTVPGPTNISKIGLPSLQELPHVASGSILRRIDLKEYATSSKIEALTMELVNMRKYSPGSKAIIFSQFVNMLDLIRWRLHSDPYLKEMGLGVRAIHGSMDVKSRDSALKDFREDVNVRVLLMSLKAGGVALNLTVANHIYLMDPWWNPAAEMQAIDRTHRLGQHRPIRAVRFIASNTVEERILQLQEKKRLVFDGTVGRDAGSLKMLTVDDMKSLFG